MVAPNGARRSKRDHPALPVSIPETVAAVAACYEAGARGAHLHVRDAEGRHVLDAGLYRELLAELALAVPEMLAQVTTEAAGLYTPRQQIALVRELVPRFASVALREILSEGDEIAARRFYHWAREAGVNVQHILYDAAEVAWLADLVGRGVIPGEDLELLFVLGRYGQERDSEPADLAPFLDTLARSGLAAGWAACAFGRRETDCLVEAIARGGKARIGFENNLYNRRGGLARDNAERVAELVAALAEADVRAAAGVAASGAPATRAAPAAPSVCDG
ncbi:MAG: 3-keto-5-aminohexanoate cleavage protein [Alphaproteobacteria bacterium]|nr:MAG: 3-keto-5-aminohexanoate cleavage protein [Alphaproteobacteria bacterium]